MGSEKRRKRKIHEAGEAEVKRTSHRYQRQLDSLPFGVSSLQTLRTSDLKSKRGSGVDKFGSISFPK